MARKKTVSKSKDTRRRYTDEFKEEAVQMMLDGHTAPLMERLGLPNVNMLYRWKQERLTQSGPVASSLEARVRELENELRRVERERDVLKKRYLFSAAANSRCLCGHRSNRFRRRSIAVGDL